MSAHFYPSTTICQPNCTCTFCMTLQTHEDVDSHGFPFPIPVHQQSVYDSGLSQNYEISSASSSSSSPNVVPQCLRNDYELENHEGVAPASSSPKYIFDHSHHNATHGVGGTTASPAFQLSPELMEHGDAYLRQRFRIPPGVKIGLDALSGTIRKKQPDIMGLILLSIWQSPKKRLSLKEIHSVVSKQCPELEGGNGAWKGSIRHKLSYKAGFIKMRAPPGEKTRGCLWTFDPTFGDTISHTRAPSKRSSGSKRQSTKAGGRISCPSSVADTSAYRAGNEPEASASAPQVAGLSLSGQWPSPSTSFAQYSPHLEPQYFPSTVPQSIYDSPQVDSYMSAMPSLSASQTAYMAFPGTAYPTYTSTMPSYTLPEYYEPYRTTRNQGYLRSMQAGGSRQHSSSSKYSPY